MCPQTILNKDKVRIFPLHCPLFLLYAVGRRHRPITNNVTRMPTFRLQSLPSTRIPMQVQPQHHCHTHCTSARHAPDVFVRTCSRSPTWCLCLIRSFSRHQLEVRTLLKHSYGVNCSETELAKQRSNRQPVYHMASFCNRIRLSIMVGRCAGWAGLRKSISSRAKTKTTGP